MKTLALLTLLLIMSGSAMGQMLKSNVTSSVGKDVLLSFNCSNDPKELIWQKDEIIVNVHPQDKSIIDDSYVDRTQLFINKEKRNCSLLLLNISTADAGVYTCHALAKVDNTWSRSSSEINLTVESNSKKDAQIEQQPATTVSVSVPIALTVLILAILLLLILWIRRQHRANTDNDLAAGKPMLQIV